MRWSGRAAAAAVAAMGGLLAGCAGSEATLQAEAPPASPSSAAPAPSGPAPSEPAPSEPSQSEPNRQAAVYAAVLDRYLDRELSVGGPDRVGTVYLVSSVGTDQASSGEQRNVPAAVRHQVAANLAEDYRVRWVSSVDEADITGRIDCEPTVDRDVAIALGQVPIAGQRIDVTLDGYADCGLAGGWVYRLGNQSGSWGVLEYSASWQAR